VLLKQIFPNRVPQPSNTYLRQMAGIWLCSKQPVNHACARPLAVAPGHLLLHRGPAQFAQAVGGGFSSTATGFPAGGVVGEAFLSAWAKPRRRVWLCCCLRLPPPMPMSQNFVLGRASCCTRARLATSKCTKSEFTLPKDRGENYLRGPSTMHSAFVAMLRDACPGAALQA